MSRYYAAVDIETNEVVLYYRTRKQLMSYLDSSEEGVKYIIKTFKNCKEMGVPKRPFRLPDVDDNDLPF